MSGTFETFLALSEQDKRDLFEAAAGRLDTLPTYVEAEDVDQQTLFIEFPTLYPSGEVSYVSPRVRIEAGARSALDPSLTCTVTPYVADELHDWSFAVDNIRVIAPERTYWEKLLILHGVHCRWLNGNCRDRPLRTAADGRRAERSKRGPPPSTPQPVGRARCGRGPGPGGPGPRGSAGDETGAEGTRVARFSKNCITSRQLTSMTDGCWIASAGLQKLTFLFFCSNIKWRLNSTRPNAMPPCKSVA